MPYSDAPSVTSLLEPGRVRVGLQAATRDEAIAGVVALLEGAPEVDNAEAVLDDVLRREELLSTGVGHGLALPHARSLAVTGTVAALAVTAEGVDYDAFDGEPVRLVLLLVGPDTERSQHVRLLSRISRLMSDEAFRTRLLAAPDEAAVLDAFREAEAKLG